ncbi:MAG TPA: Vms1/Ankzf1 family peptidyl-tRNA hydrolase [Gaiellaceae bacterium]|nr:Vms1/Ankzf1 family peptidyl-tRNA hydrolase [Gaiellaceae bacterium]
MVQESPRMAGSVTWVQLRELAGFRTENGCAISVYVNLDPSEVPTPGDAQSRMNALLAAAEKTERTDLTHDARAGLKRDFERIARWFDDDFERDGARGLAIFAAGNDNFWSTLTLPERVPDSVRVGRDFYLAPLVPLVARSDGAIIAVVGREQGQLFRLRDGRLHEIVQQFDEQPGQHDQGGWSQARYQRHIEKLVQEHLKGVAEELDRTRRRMQAPKVVLVCSEEMRAEFTEALSAAARDSIAGWAPAEAHATPAQLLAAVTPVLEKAQSKDEQETIARWREEAGRNGRAASGWAETLEAASDGRVDLLLFREGVDHPAFRCPACGRAAIAGGSCPLDGTSLEPVDAGLDLAVHQTLAHGGAVWAIRHHDDLAPVEGIGALLRY